jgi:hypothetical protein
LALYARCWRSIYISPSKLASPLQSGKSRQALKDLFWKGLVRQWEKVKHLMLVRKVQPLESSKVLLKLIKVYLICPRAAV